MRKFFRRLLVKLGIIKPKVFTGAKAVIKLNGLEIPVESVKYTIDRPLKDLTVLGRMEAMEVGPETVTIEGKITFIDHEAIERMVRGEE